MEAVFLSIGDRVRIGVCIVILLFSLLFSLCFVRFAVVIVAFFFFFFLFFIHVSYRNSTRVVMMVVVAIQPRMVSTSRAAYDGRFQDFETLVYYAHVAQLDLGPQRDNVDKLQSQLFGLESTLDVVLHVLDI